MEITKEVSERFAGFVFDWYYETYLLLGGYGSGKSFHILLLSQELYVKTIISPPDKNGNRAIRVEKIEKEVPPNPTAIMCWLNNRKPEQWKRNRDMMYTEDKDNSIVVNIIRKGDNDSDEREDWAASASEDIKKRKAKKVKQEPDNLDYWPDE